MPNASCRPHENFLHTARKLFMPHTNLSVVLQKLGRNERGAFTPRMVALSHCLLRLCTMVHSLVLSHCYSVCVQWCAAWFTGSVASDLVPRWQAAAVASATSPFAWKDTGLAGQTAVLLGYGGLPEFACIISRMPKIHISLPPCIRRRRACLARIRFLIRGPRPPCWQVAEWRILSSRV